MQVPRNVNLYVGDLKKYLAHHQISPEVFAKTAQLSHMTIRRWMKKKSREPLPSKYLPTLGPLLGKTPSPELPKVSLARALKSLSVDALIQEIERSGAGFRDWSRLEEAVHGKLETSTLDKTFEHCCHELLKIMKSVQSSIRAKAIATGALLYFIHPQRVPDDTPLVEYLGELAILSVALNEIRAA